MLDRRIRLFSIFGFDVRIDASWLLLAALIAWSLAEGVFPELSPGLAAATYWWMSLAVTIGLLLSIVFHEAAHSLVARRFGISIRGITLFVFGGVAEMEGEPRDPRSEFLMAVAGPVSSLLLAAVFLMLCAAAGRADLPTPLVGTLWYLGYANGILGLFNLVPAFPLDGGRMLRAGLWTWRGDIIWATRIAAGVGGLFGLLLVVFGIMEVFRGDFIGGIWQFLIGMFIRGAAGTAYQQTVAEQVFGNLTVAQIMDVKLVAAAPTMTVADFVDAYVYRLHCRDVPVAQDGKIIGMVGTRQVAALGRPEWPGTTIGQIMVPCTDADVVEADSRALDALVKLSRAHRSRLFAVENGRFVGVISLRDFAEILAVRLDLLGDRNRAESLLRAR